MQNQEYLKKFNENMSIIKKINAKDLIRREELGVDLNFAEAEDDFEQAINLFKSLSDLDISLIPDQTLHILNDTLTSFITSINSIKTYSATEGLNKRQSLISDIKNNYSSWFSTLSPVIAFCIKSGTDYDALQRKSREALESFIAELTTAKKERETAKKDIEEIVQSVRKAAAEVGVTQHTTNFSDAAKVFSEGKTFWMRSILIDLVLIIVYSFWAFWHCPILLTEPYSYTFIQAGLPRFTGLIALFYFLFIATSNYRAQAHNYIINKNKQNALSTFETFVKATDNEEIKNAVLLQTTKSIFANTASGYLKNEASGDDSSQIIEIVKDVSKLAKP